MDKCTIRENETAKTEKKAKIIILSLVFIVGVLIGFYFGTVFTIYQVAQLASGFVDIDYATVEAALFKYKNHIIGDLNNAHFFNDSWNKTRS